MEHKLQDAGLYVFNVIIVILMIINKLNWSHIACLCTHSWPVKRLINTVCMLLLNILILFYVLTPFQN